MSRVLFVDDELLVVQGLARMLHYDFEVDTATSGLDAKELLAKKTYSVLVSDMKMPGMSGARLLQFAYENYPCTARLLLTAQCDVDEQSMAISQGHVHGMLYKPCTAAELRNTLADAISKVSHRRCNALRDLSCATAQP